MNKPGIPATAHAHAHAGGKRGPSSFAMHDPATVFQSLAPRPGDQIMDLGCGPGDYTMEMAARVGDSGLVHALDNRLESINKVRERAASAGQDNILPMLHDVFSPFPLEDACLDLCLAATMLHILDIKKNGPALFPEVRRVLKKGGRFAVIECKKEDQPWGPPKERRLSPEELRRAVEPCGFTQSGYTDLGPTYLIQFTAV